MNTLKIAICEDDTNEQDRLLNILKTSKYSNEITLFSSGEEFLSNFNPGQFDMIFMDIFMNDITGIDVVTKVRAMDKSVPVAFVTSSLEFTRESYQLDAIKYIEKPVTSNKIEDVLQLAFLKKQAIDKLEISINHTSTEYLLSNILYLEQNARSLNIYLTNGEVVVANKKLIEVESQLIGKGFLRCHKSYIVNLDYIDGVDRELSAFVMTQGSMVYIRKRSFREFQKLFEDYLFVKMQGV